jgi:hypothetical protein
MNKLLSEHVDIVNVLTETIENTINLIETKNENVSIKEEQNYANNLTEEM